ncbi:MAG: hypothetical protein NPIRA05_00660 [Nitrospirales bacterium]|nr:MAG: hypothetical protein NPIRA05_00660 [Nitrospirales bacterium]
MIGKEMATVGETFETADGFGAFQMAVCQWGLHGGWTRGERTAVWFVDFYELALCSWSESSLLDGFSSVPMGAVIES